MIMRCSVRVHDTMASQTVHVGVSACVNAAHARLCVFVCVRACVCSCVRACVCLCVRACMRVPVPHLCMCERI